MCSTVTLDSPTNRIFPSDCMLARSHRRIERHHRIGNVKLVDVDAVERSRFRLPSTASRKCAGLASWVHWFGPGDSIHPWLR